MRQHAPSVVVPVLAYHQVEPARDRPPDRPGLVVDAMSFRRQILLLRALGYRAIGMDELAAGLAGDRILPRRAVVLTFDDGYAGVYQFAFPILRRYGFKGTLFLIAEDFDADAARSVQRAFPIVTRRQVAEMIEAGFEPGSHTLTHPRLPDLPSERAHAEIDRSKAILEAAFGQRLAAFCYPYGAYNRALELAVTEAGYRCAVTTHFGRRHRPAERFALKRISVGHAQSLAQFAYRLLLAREA